MSKSKKERGNDVNSETFSLIGVVVEIVRKGFIWLHRYQGRCLYKEHSSNEFFQVMPNLQSQAKAERQNNEEPMQESVKLLEKGCEIVSSGEETPLLRWH